ncbi:nitroreductase family protein [Acanthopleuribacter pedis]|uniref:Putative NAD(P)H nitroreductase n=1 Tax=Acanthopleuribacter pedis TaxID=442870 RepID=A0A8J7QEI5_9BACT|nr:nitroreductase [Acanthopleuribacter pedis]MBO1316870.1 nitroreductase [Acanthopleuribacter pedis]
MIADHQDYAKHVLNAIHHRRSLPSASMKPDPLKEEHLAAILEAANQAPSHRHTEPWRFRIYQSEAARDDLGQGLAKVYQSFAGPSFFEAKFKKTRLRPTLVPVVIAVICSPGEKANLPLYEEILAVGCAVQNMHLAAHALGVGMIWSTPGYYDHPELRELMEMAENSHFMGLLYLGYPACPFPTSKRRPLSEKTVWL